MDSISVPAYSFFGKLPGAGDFISRRMSYRAQQYWDQWCASGLEQLKESSPAQGWAVWRNMPMWGFLLPAQSELAFGQLGVIAPSCDRVGRLFPILVSAELRAENVQSLLMRAGLIGNAWAKLIGHAQHARLSIDAFDAELQTSLTASLHAETPIVDSDQTLPPGESLNLLPWPGIEHQFDLFAGESYWWSVPPESTGFRARTHRGALTGSQFVSLTV